MAQTLVSTIGGVPGTGAITTVVGGSTVSNATVMQFVGASVTASGATTALVTIPGALSVGGTAGQIQFNSGGTVFGGINASITPQGRMTLTSGSPVMSADVVNTGTLYYCTYAGNLIPIAGQLYVIPSDQIQCTLDTTNHANAKLYDCFCMISSGAVTMVTGPAWTNTTTRATAVTLFSGVWTNGATITSAFNAGLAHTLVTNAGTYVGTIYTTASGQTGMAFATAATSGGGNNILGLYNAYNRVLVQAVCKDSNINWTYNSTAFRAMDNSLNNRISWVDGLGTARVAVSLAMLAQPSATGQQAQIGVWINVTSGNPSNGIWMQQQIGTGQTGIIATGSAAPALGFNFAQGTEQSSSGTATFNMGGLSGLQVVLEM